MRREEKGRGSGGVNPPSRHLWVGNLPQGISERELTERFLRFGELESVAFQPGRSYAFLNFKHEEDAFVAIESLKGFPLADNPLRIEFAKADKSSSTSRNEDQFRRDDQRTAARGSPFIQRDSRGYYESPDSYSRSKMSDKDAEPSEVLWIGFPAMLRVDEAILRKAFSPFGEIDKITVFPGRSYAFVQFRSLVAACRAKETLHGKLFGNPRVHICFAKSEPSSSNTGRGPSSGSLSPPYRSLDRMERNYESISRKRNERELLYADNIDFGDPDDYMYSRKGASRNDGSRDYDNLRSTHIMMHNMHELHGSPRERVSTFREGSQRFSSRNSGYEELWDLPEDDYYQESKRLKMANVLPEEELPEYPLSGLDRERRLPESFQRNYEDGPRRHRRMHEHHEEWSSLRAPHDDYQTGALSLPSNDAHERQRYMPEPDWPSLKDWKWEGTIAKGGNPICRARCFPVGKVMDMILPEFVDCTARTGLDMLAKHYYQASHAWVIFFVPGSDADIGFYNEFRHYLEEKQRAAVSKLDDRTTLFLVPPSDFSEKVLKVPGKLSISGVVLRLEYPAPRSGPAQHLGDRNLFIRHAETSYPRASGAFSDLDSSGINSDFSCNVPRGFRDAAGDPYFEERQEWPPMNQHAASDWPPPSGFRTSQPQASSSSIDEHGHHHMAMPRQSLDSDPSLSGIQPEQLAHLASSLLGQQKPLENSPKQFERYTGHGSHESPELSAPSQYNYMQPTSSVPPMGQREVQSISNQNVQGEEPESNPQKRLQDTLQLAAVLLQQIQQAKGP